MAKKPVKQIVTHRCKDCIYCTPDKSNLSNSGKPILGTCEFKTEKKLINHEYCEKFKR